MTEILLIRHGQTIWNNSGKYQGHTDIPLSDIGREQAIKLSKKIQTKNIAAFYASDLSRAYETAKLIAEPFGKEIKVLPELREINFGEWEGLSYVEIMEKYKDLATAWYNNPGAVCIPGGESCEQLRERSYSIFTKLVEAHGDETIAIVSHGGTVRMLIMAAMGWDISCFWRLRQDNTALNILNYKDGSAILKLFNDTCHLQD